MTSWWGWARRRARASTGLLLTLLALVTATTAILAGTVGYSGAAATTAAREALTGGPPSEAGIRVQTRLAGDPTAQDGTARGLIAQAFDPAPVSVQRTLVSEPRPVTGPDGDALDGRLVVMGSDSLQPEDPQAAGRVEVVEGTWPTDDAGTGSDTAVEGMLHAGTARAWDVAVGDTLQVAGTPVALVGTWRPKDAADPYWFGDPLVVAGTDEEQRGPLVVGPGSVAQLIDAPFVRWTVQPDTSRIQPDDLAHLASAAASLQGSLKVPAVDVRGVTVDGDLAPTADTAATNLATARALGVIPLSVLVLVTLLAVVQLARLLATTRESQAQLLVARGATRAQLLTSTLAEALAVTLLGTVVGALVAFAVLQAVPAGDAQGPVVLRVATLTGLAVLLVLAAVAAAQARRVSSGVTGGADLSGRTRAATALATVVLVLGAAAVAWWQLRRNGSPLVTRADGTLGTDLVAGAAPALLLAAAAVLAMALLGPAGRLIELLTRPGRSAAGHLASAQVSRRLPVYAVPAVLTVLAVGATTLSGLYAGTSAHLRDNLATVAQGAPVRATLVEPLKSSEPGTASPPAQTLEDVPGVGRTSPVWIVDDARLADLSLPLTIAPVDQLAGVVTTPDLPAGSAPLVPTGALDVAPDASLGLALPPGTTRIEVDVDIDVTVDPSALQELQASYESLVDDLAGTGDGSGDLVLGPGSEPLPEDEARATARGMLDERLRYAQEGGPTQDWKVSLTLVDPRTGQRQTVDGATVEVDRATVEPPAADAPYTEAPTQDGGGAATVLFTLPEGTDLVVRDVRLELPLARDDRGDPVRQSVRATLAATTDDGTALFGDPTRGWGSTEAAPPDVVEEAQREADELSAEGGTRPRSVFDPRTGDVFTFDGSVHVPPMLDVTGRTWVLEGISGTNLPPALTVAPDLSYTEPQGLPARGEQGRTPERTEPEDEIPVALTPAAARAADLTVGESAQVKAFGLTLPVRLAAVVPAVPGTLAPQAALVDRDAVAAVLAEEDRALPYPTQVWATPGDGTPAAALVEAVAARPDVSAVAGPGTVRVTDATSAARLVFWVASAGAVLLAATGVAAVAATLLSSRRAEVAVLRALGMPPRAQARSRALELGGVVLAATALGLGAGWLVSRMVVTELARSTTQPGQVVLPAPLRLEAGPWAALLVAGAVVALLVVLLQAARVARQAVDLDYREEIR
ncbi:FtsX-like permease family protein [Ornithinimicrobium tianjinense]|nr:ABC transporter permease [Ornithinimicrobium tianjinense]